MTYLATIYYIGVVTNLVVMVDCQCLNSKYRDIKASITKLITKVKDMLSADLAGVSTQTVPEEKKLLEQLSELDDAIEAKINTAEEFEEEITNADTYQTTLEECIPFLSEFITRLACRHLTTQDQNRSYPRTSSHHPRKAEGANRPQSQVT